jgi:hypothetical protein
VDCVVREEVAKLRIQLGRERLVVGEDGRPTRAMTLAIVNVLPEPVTPISTCEPRPSAMPRTRASMAAGWSPAGA